MTFEIGEVVRVGKGKVRWEIVNIPFGHANGLYGLYELNSLDSSYGRYAWGHEIQRYDVDGE